MSSGNKNGDGSGEGDNPRPDKGSKKPRLPSPPAGMDDWLGRKLKDYYADILSEPLPDDLAELIKKLDENDPENETEPPSGENEPTGRSGK